MAEAPPPDDKGQPGAAAPPPKPEAAADKPAGATPAEPLKGDVSRTEAPGAAAAPAGQPAAAGAASAAKPAAGAGAPPAARPAPPARPATPAAGAGGAAHAPAAAPPSGPPDPPPPADKPVPSFITALQAAIPGGVTAVSYWVGDWTIIVPAAQLLNVARRLRDASDAAFDLCSDVTAVDWPPRKDARFDVVYCLYSTRHRHRVRVKVQIGDAQPLASVVDVWPAANWLEREVYDMFGVNLTGHPDRRRILMPEDWQGFPQRKDYPLEGPGELLMENPIDWLKLRQARDEADIE